MIKLIAKKMKMLNVQSRNALHYCPTVSDDIKNTVKKAVGEGAG